MLQLGLWMAITQSARFRTESANLSFEQLDGELDAGLVFACAAAEARRADAWKAYRSVLERLRPAALSGSQLQSLQAKLLRLHRLLDPPRPARGSAGDEAA